MERIEIEVCVGSYHEAVNAALAGANRIELCSALCSGGLTPDENTVNHVVRDIDNACKVHVMIRPSEGNFLYSTEEYSIMKDSITSMSEIGVAGVVFGLLDQAGNMDSQRTGELTQLAKMRGLQTTFHRAFDLCAEPLTTLDELIGIGIDRLLTSGQQEKAADGIGLIEELLQHSNGRIDIVPGSGVDASNARRFIEIGAQSLHFTSRIAVQGNDSLGFGNSFEFDIDKYNSIKRQLS